MREEIITAVRYNPILGREVVVRLTYTVGEGPRPDIIRWFLVKEEVQKLLDCQSSIYSDKVTQGQLSNETGNEIKQTPMVKQEPRIVI
jgi:hypothetical protein